MKRLSLFLSALAVAALALVGCAPAPGPVPVSAYSIFKRFEGTGGKTVMIEVPANSSKAQLLSVGQDVEAKEKVAGKEFVASFFYEGHNHYYSEEIAYYSDGEVHERRAP